MAKRKGLGRGLDALLSGSSSAATPAEAIKAATEVAPKSLLPTSVKTAPSKLYL
jgi:hypothetical protein